MQTLEDAAKELRGNGKVTDQNPEGKYEALKRFARDLTEEARKGALDPVIGRDDEIRRCIQILSRRSKNNPVLIGERAAFLTTRPTAPFGSGALRGTDPPPPGTRHTAASASGFGSVRERGVAPLGDGRLSFAPRSGVCQPRCC